jgi:hypothetical protein
MLFRVAGFALATTLFGQVASVQPPVPNDPLELVTGDVQPVLDAEQRAAATSLLKRARELSNVRAYAYDLKTTFVSAGASEGTWSLEDTSPARNVYRWTAQGPSYAATNLYTNELLYGNQTGGSMPLRLAQARTAIFFAYHAFGPQATMRTATGSLNGAEVSCVLLSHAGLKPGNGGRRWEESEYCMDAKSGLLMRYSPVPGMFVSYDYTSALRFHDKSIPGKFTITQAGQTIVEARTESVADPGKVDPALFQPAGLEKIGVGALMTRPWKVRTRVGSSRKEKGAPVEVVVLDGMVTPDGKMGDVQVVASSNAALNQAAMEKAASFQSWQTAEDAQPGATPLSHEVYFTVEFGPRQ